jgi:hypothetical protein
MVAAVTLAAAASAGCGSDSNTSDDGPSTTTPASSSPSTSTPPTMSMLHRQWVAAAKRAVVRFEHVTDQVANRGKVDTRAEAMLTKVAGSKLNVDTRIRLAKVLAGGYTFGGFSRTVNLDLVGIDDKRERVKIRGCVDSTSHTVRFKGKRIHLSEPYAEQVYAVQLYPDQVWRVDAIPSGKTQAKSCAA